MSRTTPRRMPVGPLDAEPQDLGPGVPAVAGHLADDRDDLGGAEIEPSDQALGLRAHAPAHRTIT